MFVPVNASLKPAQVRHIVADCGARVLLSSAAMLGKLDGALEAPYWDYALIIEQHERGG